MRRTHLLPFMLDAATLVSAGVVVALSGCQRDRIGSLEPLGPRSVRPSYQLVHDLSIGEVNGPPEYNFGYISDVAIGFEGSIYVADSQAGTVRQFGSDGRFIRSFGRPGTGPGEFVEGPHFVTVDREGRVLVGDKSVAGAMAASRIHVYSKDGKFIKTWAFERFIEGPITVDSAGYVYVRMAGAVPSNGRPINAPEFLDTRATSTWEARALSFSFHSSPQFPVTSPGTVRIAPDGVSMDTIAAPVSNEHVIYTPYSPPYAAARVNTAFAYSPFTWWAWSPLGYMLSGSSSEYVINIHELGPRGASRVLVSGATTPIQLSREERKLVQWAADEMRASAEVWVGNLEAPNMKPSYHSVFISQEGDVWVGLHVPSVQKSGVWSEPVALFDVWEPAGVHVGLIQGPKDVRHLIVGGNAVVTWISDELGVQRVVRYRVVPM